VVEAYDFAMTSTLVDVGGGDATMLVAILTANPGLQGVLFDRASLMTRAKKHIADSGLAERCKTVAGDFFRSLPVGADAYLLVRCLRAFDDQRAAHILLAARRAIRPDGRLLIVERILLPDGENIDAALGDLNMLVLTGGSERSAGEFERLLDRAGFQLARIIRTRSAMSILEAIPNRRSPTFRVSDTLAKEEYMQ
jgi:ubiquinone/menaquinone biosynthesis C-methylase UbiE